MQLYIIICKVHMDVSWLGSRRARLVEEVIAAALPMHRLHNATTRFAKVGLDEDDQDRKARRHAPTLNEYSATGPPLTTPALICYT